MHFWIGIVSASLATVVQTVESPLNVPPIAQSFKLQMEPASLLATTRHVSLMELTAATHQAALAPLLSWVMECVILSATCQHVSWMMAIVLVAMVARKTPLKLVDYIVKI
jgi:hypothetical protein